MLAIQLLRCAYVYLLCALTVRCDGALLEDLAQEEAVRAFEALLIGPLPQKGTNSATHDVTLQEKVAVILQKFSNHR